uniref:Uncharacterized protein n=1 Tax=Arundo donax TaxID=35708 RepID=A0A0A8YIG3_ARUDO
MKVKVFFKIMPRGNITYK